MTTPKVEKPMTNNKELLACAHCGTEAEIYEYETSWFVQCRNPHCGVRVKLAYEGNAIRAWNTRPSQPKWDREELIETIKSCASPDDKAVKGTPLIIVYPDMVADAILAQGEK